MPPVVLRILAVLVASTSVAACGGSDDDATLVVFAASSLTRLADPLAEAFVATSAEIDRVEVDTGGSDSLARLINDGAPADVLLTADLDTMDLLEDPVDPAVVAHNRAAIVVPTDNPAGIESVADLAGSAITLAVCEPAVPCGGAALRLFEQAGIDPTPDTLEPNVRSVLTKVELGEVDAGVVYRTDAASSTAVREIAVDDAPRLPVAAAAVGDDTDADAFVTFLASDEAAAIFAMHGFEGP
jgi:molybdate transport system substrate-binding protein